MTYIKVCWLHSSLDDPVLLYSELDDDRWEVRKVELYRDGRRGYASADKAGGDTRLGLVAVPPLDEIASDPQFEVAEISAADFEAIWQAAVS